ncbi:hypothetical protein H6503_04665 [Candidatus Woesearchaeota archaeon]|nr:hypothetical protein [Candidatus Woesearchaeota archaeon]
MNSTLEQILHDLNPLNDLKPIKQARKEIIEDPKSIEKRFRLSNWMLYGLVRSAGRGIVGGIVVGAGIFYAAGIEINSDIMNAGFLGMIADATQFGFRTSAGQSKFNQQIKDAVHSIKINDENALDELKRMYPLPNAGPEKCSSLIKYATAATALNIERKQSYDMDSILAGLELSNTERDIISLYCNEIYSPMKEKFGQAEAYKKRFRPVYNLLENILGIAGSMAGLAIGYSVTNDLFVSCISAYITMKIGEIAADPITRTFVRSKQGNDPLPSISSRTISALMDHYDKKYGVMKE